jgi:inosose dehydratase
MAVRLGINPIGWTNDCMHWLGGNIPLDTCLSQAKAAGFSGVELGRKFPRTVSALRPILRKHGLALVSGWYSGEILRRDWKSEMKAMKPHFDLLKGLGCDVLVYAEAAGNIINEVGAGASTRPRIEGAQNWKRYCDELSALADAMAEKGLRMAVHHHMGTAIESAEDIDRLMAGTCDTVGLLLDTGHLTFAGGDPVQTARKHIGRINHVHCKDIRGYTLEACRRRNVSFSQAVISGIFTVPGDGIVDYPKVFGILAKGGYAGWVVQEAEQDPRCADPEIFAELGNAYIRKLCASAGLKIAE